MTDARLTAIDAAANPLIWFDYRRSLVSSQHIHDGMLPRTADVYRGLVAQVIAAYVEAGGQGIPPASGTGRAALTGDTDSGDT